MQEINYLLDEKCHEYCVKYINTLPTILPAGVFQAEIQFLFREPKLKVMMNIFQKTTPKFETKASFNEGRCLKTTVRH
jgi:hypothetical protein